MNVFIIRDNCSIDQDDQNFNLIFVFFFLCIFIKFLLITLCVLHEFHFNKKKSK